MGSRLNGITIQLEVATVTDTDEFNVPVQATEWVDVENVLVGQPTDAEQVDAMNLYGKRAVYILGIPKGDENVWTSGLRVSFFDEEFRIFGHTIQGIEDMIPLDWNKKVMVASVG